MVKLLDFGVSKIIAGATKEWDDETDLTKTGMVMGTPYYMSPEQARGDRNLDGRVDLYACGVLLYEALTGHRPFVASNYNSLLVMILKGNAAPVRSLRASIPAEIEARRHTRHVEEPGRSIAIRTRASSFARSTRSARASPRRARGGFPSHRA